MKWQRAENHSQSLNSKGGGKTDFSRIPYTLTYTPPAFFPFPRIGERKSFWQKQATKVWFCQAKHFQIKFILLEQEKVIMVC